MVPRTLCIALAAGLSCPFLPAQTGNNLFSTPKTEVLTPEKRADILMARKMYREAAETYQQDSLENPVIWNKIGIAHHQMLQLEQAKRYYERAVKMKPDYAEALNNLGTIYYAKKSYRRAA